MEDKLREEIEKSLSSFVGYLAAQGRETAIDRVSSLIEDVVLKFIEWDDYSDWVSKRDAFNYFIKNIYQNENTERKG